MSRYEIITNWSNAFGDRQPIVTENNTLLVIQSADIRDTHNGQVYRDGAHRVVKGVFQGADDDIQTKDLKPVKVGKGGTVPFLGETSWSDAVRLFDDTEIALRYAR